MTHAFSRTLRRRFIAVSGGTAAIALLAGCAGGSSGSDASAPQEGGDLTFLIDSLGDTWVPNNGSISSFQGHIFEHITDKLVYVDENGQASPWIAESWEQNDAATEFTLDLRDDATFSDGSPLDAEAVVANLDAWAFGDPENGINPIGLFPKTYEQAEAVDEQTVRVEFSAPTLGFIPTLGYHGSILVSPETLELPVEEQADLDNIVGSGPFVVDSWKEADNVVLTKRDDYDWNPEAFDREGPANLDSLTYKQVAESATRTGAVQSGQAHVAYNVTPKELAGLEQQGFTIGLPQYLGFVEGLRLNARIAPFDDVKVRQAFQHGIDREDLLSTVYTDGWAAAESFIQSNVPEATDHSEAFAYDPERAQQLLDEAGWTPGADGVREKDGKRLEVTLYSNPYIVTGAAVDELIAQQLGRIGFDVSIESYDVVTYGERVIANADLSNYPVSRSFVDAGTVASILTDENNGEDWFGVGTSDETLTRLQDEIAQATDADTRAAALDELQAYVLEQAYFIPRTQMVQRIYAQSPDVDGVTYNALAYANYTGAWLND